MLRGSPPPLGPASCSLRATQNSPQPGLLVNSTRPRPRGRLRPGRVRRRPPRRGAPKRVTPLRRGTQSGAGGNRQPADHRRCRRANSPCLGSAPSPREGFRLVAAMNPDNIGTARVSGAVYDRMSHRDGVPVPRQRIRHCRAQRRRRRPAAPRRGCHRATRNHPDVRVGSSVRGAIDLVEVGRVGSNARAEVTTSDIGLDAALTALSGRIRLHEGGSSTPESVITDLWEAVLAQSNPLMTTRREKRKPRAGRLGVP